MIGLLLGLLLMVQPPDSVDKNIPVLHDSLVTAEGHIDLTEFSNWKYKSGDDTVWADPDYDDSDWHSINSFSEITDSLFQGIGWLRITLRVDSAYSREQRFINYGSLGASTLYVDGEKISEVGNPSANPEREVVKNTNQVSQYFHPVTIQPGQQITIAIRYSLHDYSFYNKFSVGFEPVQLIFRIADSEVQKSAIQQGQNFLITSVVISLILLMVMGLHLIMHFRFKEEKGNFWIFILSLMLFIPPTIMALGLTGVIESQKILYLNDSSSFVRTLLLFLPISFIPICLGRLLKVEIDNRWFYLMLFPFMAVIIDVFANGNVTLTTAFIIFGILLLIVAVGAFIIIRKAKKNSQKYLWLITGSLFSYPIVLLLGNLLFNVLAIDIFGLIMLFEILLYTMLPMGFSVYQMQRFFNAHGNLEEEVKERTAELEIAYADLQKSLKDLKATQNQLVQQEKLASLGQLTAGIAHEIKNPLNFVNNFSDLSVELVEEAREELQGERAKGKSEKVEEALEILGDIEANLRKIHEHGSRADSIVKSMLEHSRGGSGKMEPTDLNGLVEEYVNLSFHGMRASETPINVDIQMELDEDVGEVPLIAEDFSRVIVNLCNNAFDAMRGKLSEMAKAKGEKYVPKLTVRTKKADADDSVSIEVEDNGPGIPEEMKDKILQPFFTTKKGMEGTGLGLSITNDIVKAHGGALNIESNNGTKMIIQLRET